jgi:spore germination protein KC
MKKILLLLVIVSQVLVLTGCWGAKTIIEQTLVTGLGIDFKDNKYVVTIQALNFSNIAKQEGGTLQEAPPQLIGQASGESIQAALDEIDKKTPMPLYYGHVGCIILSKSIIEKEMKSVNTFVNGAPLLRYTNWIYGTEKDVKEILTSQSFFNLPFLDTVVFNPDDKTRGSLILLSLKYHQLISRYYQPVGTILIPSLDIEDKYFEEKEKSKVAYINGAYAISQQKYIDQLNLNDLNALNWFKQENYETGLLLEKEKVNLDVRSSKASIKVIRGGKKPKYKIIVKTNLEVAQNESGASEKFIKSSFSKKVKEDILKTVKKSEELQADLLNLSERPYRYFPKEWDTKSLNKITMDSIEDIEVKVHILGSKAYKR